MACVAEKKKESTTFESWSDHQNHKLFVQIEGTTANIWCYDCCKIVASTTK